MENRENHQGLILLNALNLHKNTVESLWELSQMQNRYLKDKKFHQLLEIRQQKEELLQNLKKWSNEIRLFTESWQNWRDLLSDHERQRMAEITDNISRLVEKMLDLELENRVLLDKRREELAKDLGTINFYQECLYTSFENRN